MNYKPTLSACRSGACLSIFLLFCFSVSAQTNVRAWYAQGQVWILWQTQEPYPETYAIYRSNQPFTNTNQATPIGRPFSYEYLPGTFFMQTGNPNVRYRIPKPDGSFYTLAENEALFVETTLAAGAAYYAVVEWGNTSAIAGENRTQNPVQFNYDPVNDPVNCYLQYTQTLSSGHKANWYCMWELGRQEHWAGRPDFPVMANAYKNGMPAMFIVSEALNLDTTNGKRIPLTNWFHGGGGTAIQQTADKTSHFNIAPLKGISASHNDDFPHKIIDDNGDTILYSARTLWFGWTKAHNPFNPTFHAGPGDTVINFTQRRILWINSWLVKHYRVDPDHIALQGYSMGSGGASALGKAFPNYFSTVCAFNNGFRGALDETSEQIVGSVADNLPTNLRGPNNTVVHINEVFDLNTPTSPIRDWPIFRTWAGRNDINSRMHWGPDLLAQYRKADSLGRGIQISWDERFHTYETLGLHWIQDLPFSQQTVRDNLAFQEIFSNKQSFPAFFNHRLDSNNNDPGSGTIGINNGDGDNWGTWGGWHNWDLNTITDEPAAWGVTAWLTEGAPFANDNCPRDQLTADLSIRRPQAFTPPPGTLLHWEVRDIADGVVLQFGNGAVRSDGLVVLPQIVVYREGTRKVRIVVNVSTSVTGADESSDWSIQPNPSMGTGTLLFNHQGRAQEVSIKAVALSGDISIFKTSLIPGENHISLAAFEILPSGIYFLETNVDGQRKTMKWIKL